VDAAAINNGCLPLHCALVAGNTAYFLVGESKAGKSLLARHLASSSNAKIVADDHIIVRGAKASGNSLIRTREQNDKDSYHAATGKYNEISDYIIIGHGIQEKKILRRIHPCQLIESPWWPNLGKYILSEIGSRNSDKKPIERINNSLIAQFRRHLKTFADAARGLYEIRGPVDFMKDAIKKVK
jgi:hypothetical protein